MTQVQLDSINYNGYIADITFYPTSGLTTNLGNYALSPAIVSVNYPYGSFELFFSAFNSFCYFDLFGPTPTPTITSTITPTITNTLSVTPTNSLTPTPSVTIQLTPTETPSQSASPSLTPTNTVTPTPTKSQINCINFSGSATSGPYSINSNLYKVDNTARYYNLNEKKTYCANLPQTNLPYAMFTGVTTNFMALDRGQAAGYVASSFLSSSYTNLQTCNQIQSTSYGQTPIYCDFVLDNGLYIPQEGIWNGTGGNKVKITYC